MNNLNPTVQMAGFVKSGIAAREAALYFICSGVAFMFSVCQREKNDALFMTQKDAASAMEKQLTEAMKAGAKQMAVNVRNATQLYAKLAGNPNIAKIKALVGQLSALNAKDEETAPRIIMTWLGENYNVKAVRGLSELLGYKTGSRSTPRSTPALQDAEKFADAIDDAMETVEENLVATGKVKESDVARAVLARASDPVAYIRAAIARISDTDALLTLAKTMQADIDAQLETLEKAAKAATPAVEAPAIVPEKPKGKGARVQAG